MSDSKQVVLSIDSNSRVPVYKQLMDQVENGIKSGEFISGDVLPSMNELSAKLDISKETAKKAYFLLRDKGVICSTQGKGYYIADAQSNRKMRVLLLFDKLSGIKQTLFNSFATAVGDKADITIYLHNQQVDILEYYLDENLGNFDYYVITPHFPLDPVIQKRVLKALRRIPNRKLIILDRYLSELPGNYGAVYQDFDNDAYDGLSMGLDKLRTVQKLNVIIELSSLYHPLISKAVSRFCEEYGIPYEFYSQVTPDIVRPRETYLILHSQFDMELINLARTARSKGLEPGLDFSIISYNESPMSEIVLGGLTTISADFSQMGRLAAEMIIEGRNFKQKCDFRMSRRNSF